jgi:hypothetical protein
MAWSAETNDLVAKTNWGNESSMIFFLWKIKASMLANSQ